MLWVSIILSASVVVVLAGGIWSRVNTEKGIGWQFIRFTVIAISLPICALLALNDALNGEAAAIIAGAMGYAFGKASEAPKKTKSSDE